MSKSSTASVGRVRFINIIIFSNNNNNNNLIYIAPYAELQRRYTPVSKDHCYSFNVIIIVHLFMLRKKQFYRHLFVSEYCIFFEVSMLSLSVWYVCKLRRGPNCVWMTT